VGCAILAYLFSQPWIIVIVLMLQSHALERFRNEEPEEEEMEEQPMGFMADVK
jgi:NADH pyrophosphatase NudC (nudix superfamily)